MKYNLSNMFSLGCSVALAKQIVCVSVCVCFFPINKTTDRQYQFVMIALLDIIQFLLQRRPQLRLTAVVGIGVVGGEDDGGCGATFVVNQRKKSEKKERKKRIRKMSVLVLEIMIYYYVYH